MACSSYGTTPSFGAGDAREEEEDGWPLALGKKSYKIGKKRVYVAGKKIKGKPYGGPLPLYSK